MLPNPDILQMTEGGGASGNLLFLFVCLFFGGVRRDGSMGEGIGAGKNQSNILCYSILQSI